MATSNHQVLLKSRPEGRVRPSDLSHVDQALPQLKDGQALVRNALVSVDPTHRIWMSEQKSYLPPIALGDVVRAGGLGHVVASQSARYKVGDVVSGWVGWQEYSVAEERGQKAMQVLRVSDKIPLAAYAGVLGATGLTAYFGLMDIGKPQQGETVAISAAAGAVGSVAGQIAKIQGCQVVGFAGTDDKCHFLQAELGFDRALIYKAADFRAQLEQACPKGIDIDFENVGGAVMDAVVPLMNLHGRIILCGLISGYNASDEMRCPVVPLLMQRITMQGFIILDYAKRFAEGTRALEAWVLEGRIKHRETVVEGLQRAPEALNMLFSGDNMGKLLLRVD